MPATYTRKQMGDACEMLVAAELTLAGVPALRVPEIWPGYDVVAQPCDGRGPQTVSVKSRTFKRGAACVSYNAPDHFDWLAIVLLPGEGQSRRRFFLIPRALADAKARRDKATAKTAAERYWPIQLVESLFEEYEDNFALNESPQRNKA
jgi:hypothetical protein